MNRDQKQRLDKLGRTYGMAPITREYVKQELEKATDWRATCRKCGTTLTGTLKEIREHTCASG